MKPTKHCLDQKIGITESPITIDETEYCDTKARFLANGVCMRKVPETSLQYLHKHKIDKLRNGNYRT